MKSIYIICFAIFLSACGRGHQHTSIHDDHDHDVHENHEGHNHDHLHDTDHDHSHEHSDPHLEDVDGHDEHGADEIIFTRAQADAAGVKVSTVKSEPFNMTIKVGGQILPAQGDEVTIIANTSGIVTLRKTLIEGEVIKQGETLVLLSARNIAEGDPVLKAKVAYEAAKREYQRAETLVRDTLITQRDFEQARLTYETTKVAYEALAQNQTAAGFSVTAPAGGYISKRWVAEGDYVNTGQPVVTMVKTHRLQLKADVPEKYFSVLPDVYTANFKTIYDGKLYQLTELKGKLLSFGRIAEGTYLPATFEFDYNNMIVPGTYVEVYLIATPSDKSITLPLTALVEEQGVYFVFLHSGEDVYKKQEVQIGYVNGRDIQILSGVNEGDRVVTHGAMRVKLAANAAVIPEGHSH